MTKLPKIQMEALEQMKPEKWYGDYDLGIRTETLMALYRKSFLELATKPGFFGDVHQFKLKEPNDPPTPT